MSAAAEVSGASRGFIRTLALGAVAAMALPVALWLAQQLAAPIAATRAAEIGLGLYWVMAAGASLVIPASSRRARAVVVFAAFGIALIVFARAPSLPELAVALTLLVGVVRSGLLSRQGIGRGLAVEAACGVCALGVAYALYVPTVLGAALSLWGWFLVQSCFYLLAAIMPRRRSGGEDPFDLARSRLLELLGA